MRGGGPENSLLYPVEGAVTVLRSAFEAFQGRGQGIYSVPGDQLGKKCRGPDARRGLPRARRKQIPGEGLSRPRSQREVGWAGQ